MAAVSFELSEQHADLRSNEVAYRLTITNHGTKAIDLLAVDPRTPEGVEIREVSSPSLAAAKAAHSGLCDELTLLLSDQLHASSFELQEALTNIEKERAERIKREASRLGWGAMVVNTYLRFTGLLDVPELASAANAEAEQRKETFRFDISSSADARYALESLFPSSASVGRQVFEAKLTQLQRLEKELGNDEVKAQSLATIHPDSTYIATYVMQFPRDRYNPRKFNIAFDGRYTDRKTEQVGTASTSLLISPRAAPLNVIAVTGGLLGVLLRLALQPGSPTSALISHQELERALRPSLSAMILAFVVFNVYEHTNLMKTIRLGISWRSSILVGMLCGFFQDRVIAALGALVTGS